MGFNEKQVIEAYLVSDKNEDRAIHYLLSTDAESPSDVCFFTFLLIFYIFTRHLQAHAEQAKEELSVEQWNNPVFREGLTQIIEQQNPELAQQLKQDPVLFEMALQAATLRNSVLTSGENMAVGRVSLTLVDL
jgi:hypothetical protein